MNELESFAAELAAIEAAHNANRLPGDGMAVEARRLMDFTGPRVPVPPPLEPWFDAGQESELHLHDELCLVAVDEAPGNGEADKKVGPGWSECAVTGQVGHDHGGHRVAHPLAIPSARCT